MAGHADTKTIDQFLAENPNVDVTPYWERCWGILAGVKDRIADRQSAGLVPLQIDFAAFAGGELPQLVRPRRGPAAPIRRGPSPQPNNRRRP